VAKRLTQYDLLISCPGDITKPELDAIDEAVNDFNRAYEDVMDIKIRTRHWSKDSYAESGGKPQDLLNKQFVKDCDLTIALFWTRFGTPTDSWGSGTEEEIEIMLENGKQVFVGFSDISIPPSDLANVKKAEEYQRIQEFKKRYQERGLYFVYSSVEELKRFFYAHLSKHFIIRNEQDKSATDITPKLSVQAITEMGLQNNISIFNFGNVAQLNAPLEHVRELFDKISKYEIYDYIPEKLTGILGTINEANKMFHSQVSFEDDKQKLISKCADVLKIELEDNFFSLGDLQKNNLVTTPLTGPTFVGTGDEEAKYFDLHELHNSIEYWVAISQFSEKYSRLNYIKLAVVNDGTTFDEDISVALTFPKNVLIKHNALPVIDSYALDKIKQEHNLDEFFGIKRASKYLDYDSTIRRFSGSNYVPSNYISPLFSKSDPAEDFYEDLDSVFDYEYFDEGDDVILTFSIDYLKHNTAAAFPSIIFVAENAFEIKYTLKSKHFKEEVEGIIASA